MTYREFIDTKRHIPLAMITHTLVKIWRWRWIYYVKSWRALNASD